MEDEEILDDEENLAVEETDENVEEPTTEEIVEGEENSTETDNSETVTEEEKKYTEKEFNERVDDLLSKKLARKEAKIRREYEKKYSGYPELGNVVKAGLNTSDLNEATKQLRSYYEEQGVQIPAVQKNFSDREEQILAKADAEEIISAGYEDIIEELNRLTDVGVENMTTREKLVFKALSDKRQTLESEKELLSIGADQKVIDSEEYKNFIKDNGLEAVSAKKAYEIYRKLKPTPQVEQIGDLTNKNSKKDDDFISEAEYDKMTEAEIEKNFDKIRKSMKKW